jgi:PhoH-like ATPase
VELDVDGADIDRLYEDGIVDLDGTGDLPCHTGLVLRDGSRSAIARLHPDKSAHRLHNGRELFGVSGRSAEQRVAMDLLADPEVGIVSLGGPAGTGKSVLALAAGLEAVLEQQTQKRIIVFRPLFAVGDQQLGYLPGSESEKMSPWSAAVMDALESIASPQVIDLIVADGLLEVLPLTHIRGRTLVDTFVILDDAQQYERPVLVTALSRLGAGSRVVLTHDVAQRDNLRVGRYDGVMSVIGALTGNPLFGHVTLSRSERSPIAALAASILDVPVP